jgi:hypothetical protein
MNVRARDCKSGELANIEGFKSRYPESGLLPM